MTDYIIFVELPRQIQTALNAIRKFSSQQSVSLLALTPHVEYALDKLGLTYGRLEDYYQSYEIDDLGISDLRNLDQMCDALDSYLREQLPELRQNDLSPASLNHYYLKVMINSVSFRSYVLGKIFDQEQPIQVLYFDTDAEVPGKELFFVKESLWSRMIPRSATNREILIEKLRGKTDTSSLNRIHTGRRYFDLKSRLKPIARRLLRPKSIRLARSAIKRVNAGVRIVKRPSLSTVYSDKPSLLLLERDYSLGPLLRSLETKGNFNLLYWDVRTPEGPSILPSGAPVNSFGSNRSSHAATSSESNPLTWSKFNKLSELSQSATLSGLDCLPIIESRLKRFVEVDVPRIIEIYNHSQSILKNERPFAILGATMGDFGAPTVAEAARKLGVPFVVYQHGASGGHVMMESWINEVVRRAELSRADYHLGFGEGDVNYLGKAKDARAKVIPIGSCVLDGLKRGQSRITKSSILRQYGLDPNKKTILYVPTIMDGNIRIQPYCQRAPSTMFGIERRLVEVFNEFQDIQFVVKVIAPAFHPSSPISQFIKDRDIGNCAIITEPFIDLIHIADMFVIDLPSTTFLEALTTDKPIMVCGASMPWPWTPGIWHPSILDMWQERVEYSDHLNEFCDLLRERLKDGNFEPVHSDNSLLKLFGTHLDDGNSAERAYSFLYSLASKAYTDS